MYICYTYPMKCHHNRLQLSRSIIRNHEPCSKYIDLASNTTERRQLFWTLAYQICHTGSNAPDLLWPAKLCAAWLPKPGRSLRSIRFVQWGKFDTQPERNHMCQRSTFEASSDEDVVWSTLTALALRIAKAEQASLCVETTKWGTDFGNGVEPQTERRLR